MACRSTSARLTGQITEFSRVAPRPQGFFLARSFPSLIEAR
jgi:hypothetical protein